MRKAALWLLLALAACTRPITPPATPDPASRRSPPAGEIVGFVGARGSHAYLGIPYAEPPVGGLRWRAPVPARRWRGVREALRAGPACPQHGSRLNGLPIPADAVGGDEDCLYLNVYARRRGPEEVPRGDGRRPVLVWIHGGGNVIGQGASYDGGFLAASQDVVVVTFNYRLGPLGWFRHAALRGHATSLEDRSGNFGLLDMVRALEWVRENIAAFGGDPGNVTIFGESAGGRDVLALLRVPRARGLFHRAISQSGSLAYATVAEAERFVDETPAGRRGSSSEVLLRLLIADGVASDRASARRALVAMPPGEVRAYLYAKSAADLVDAYPRRGAEGLIEVPQMFPDGAVLPREAPLDALARPDGHAAVPVMLGTNRDEDKLFLFFRAELVRWTLWVLPRLRDPERYEALAAHGSAMWKAAGADEPAAALVRGGAPGVYVYRFDWDEEPSVLGADLARMLGAAHGFEIPFVFGVFDLGREARQLWTAANEPGRRRLSERMISYWIRFAETGAPGRGRDGDLPPWRPAPAFLVLDTEAGGGLRMSERTLREEDVLAAAVADPRLGTVDERCAVLAALAARSNRHRGLSPAEIDPAACPGPAATPGLGGRVGRSSVSRLLGRGLAGPGEARPGLVSPPRAAARLAPPRRLARGAA